MPECRTAPKLQERQERQRQIIEVSLFYFLGLFKNLTETSFFFYEVGAKCKYIYMYEKKQRSTYFISGDF